MNILVKLNSAIKSKRHVRNLMSAIMMWMMILPALGQAAKPAYQSATVMTVKTHQDNSAADHSVKRYDMSIKVRDMIYVVLYTPPPGSYGGQYVAGMDMLVLVGDKTITYNDLAGVSRQVPIVSRSRAPDPASH